MSDSNRYSYGGRKQELKVRISGERIYMSINALKHSQHCYDNLEIACDDCYMSRRKEVKNGGSISALLSWIVSGVKPVEPVRGERTA